MNRRLIVLGLFLGIVFLLISVKPLISPTIRQTILPPADKPYLNSQYGFQMTLPANWQIEEWDIEEAANLKKVPDGTILYQGKFFGPSTSSGQAGHFEVLIWENKGRAPVKSWLTWFRHEDLILSDLPPGENFIMAGLPAIRYLQKKTSRGKPILYIFFAKDDKIYELTEEREDLTATEATESAVLAHPVYDKILQSWQFVVR